MLAYKGGFGTDPCLGRRLSAQYTTPNLIGCFVTPSYVPRLCAIPERFVLRFYLDTKLLTAIEVYLIHYKIRSVWSQPNKDVCLMRNGKIRLHRYNYILGIKRSGCKTLTYILDPIWVIVSKRKLHPWLIFSDIGEFPATTPIFCFYITINRFGYNSQGNTNYFSFISDKNIVFRSVGWGLFACLEEKYCGWIFLLQIRFVFPFIFCWLCVVGTLAIKAIAWSGWENTKGFSLY